MLATDQILFELHMYQEHDLRKYTVFCNVCWILSPFVNKNRTTFFPFFLFPFWWEMSIIEEMWQPE